MGIDIYLEWDGMDEEEKQAQTSVGFSITDGAVGYLREAYHGGPYATRILVREAFESEDCTARIPAAVMRERLTHLTEPAYNVGGGHDAAAMIAATLRQAGTIPINATVKSDTTRPMTVEEAVRERQMRLYPEDAHEMTERVVKSFRDFVALAETKEQQTGQPCKVIASH
jgi:hypothetical protein